MDDSSTQAAERVEWWQYRTLVYVFNLFVPVCLGMIVTANGGWMGMGLGVIVCYGVGLGICAWPGHLRSAIVAGAVAVGCVQFLLVVHFVAGALALAAWTTLATPPGAFRLAGDPVLAEVGGFAVTLMTAFPLMLVALAIGYFWRWLTGDTGTARDNDPDPE